MMLILYVNLECGCGYEIGLQEVEPAEVPEGQELLPGPEEGKQMGCQDHGPQKVLSVRTETVGAT